VAAAVVLSLAVSCWWWAGQSAFGSRARLLRLAAGRLPDSVRLADAPNPPAPRLSRWRGARSSDRAFLTAAARIRAAAEREPSAANLHALGIAYLLLRKHGEAVTALRRAHETTPGTAVAIDLSAALIEQGMHAERPDLVAQAIEALSTLPGSQPPPVVFNRARALEMLGLRERAVMVWEAYLAIESSSRWAKEARRSLHRLRGTGAAPVRASEPIEREVLESLLPAWAEAFQNRRASEADLALQRATRLAAAHEALHGDSLLDSVTREIAGADRERRRRLAAAVRMFAQARAAYRQRELGACASLAQESIARLTEAGSSLAAMAALTAGNCSYLRNDLVQCADWLRRAESLTRVGTRSSPIARGQIAWLAGLAAHAASDPAAALREYRIALSSFQAARDEPRLAMVHALTADLYDYLGRTDAAWSEAVLSARAHGLEPHRRYASLQALARLAAAEGLGHVALEAASAAHQEALRTGDPGFVADAHLALGRAWARLGQVSLARAHLRRGLELARAISEPPERDRAVAFASVELAELIVASDPEQAQALALQAEGMSHAAGDLFVALARVRATTLAGQGRLDEAETILRGAVERSTGERSGLDSLEARDEALDRRAELHQALVRLLIRAGRPAAALSAMDAWRAEALVPNDGGRSSNPPRRRLPLDALPLSPAASAEVLTFLTLPEELVSWRVHRGRVQMRRSRIARSVVAALVAEAAKDAQSLRRDSRALRKLAALLLPPGLARRRLVLVPDPLLFGVPFAALPDPASGEPLIAGHELILAPSISAWYDRAGVQPVGGSCALLVRGANSGGDLYPHLRPLQWVDDELAMVARRQRCVLTAGTAEELRQGVRQRPRMVHYAGHSIAGGGVGSALLMQGSGSVLSIPAGEVESWDLTGATVFLSSCSAADGRASTTAGRDSMGRAFLTAGAHSVVASLWAVDDRDALDLATRVHDRLARGETAAGALRAAQLELRAAGKSPAAWAGWMVMGSG
jgi:tetratricopeptide (TPR) repeat protein